MAVYRYVVVDASTGAALAELPLTEVTFSRVLSGAGQFSGTLSIYHPACTAVNLGANTNASDREINVFRDDVPIYNCAITGHEASLSAGTVTITGREPSWYLSKRVLEVNKNYDGVDVFTAVRDLNTYMTTKTDGGSIVAGLPRWSISPASATAGATISDPSPPTFYGSARHLISEIIDALAADPSTGFEYRMDYKTGSTVDSVHRTLTLGYPNLGSTLTTVVTDADLYDYGRTCDWERAATRVHVLYNGGVKTLQSTAAVSDGILLSEVVADRSDTSKGSVALAYAKDLRRLGRPPVRAYEASFSPSSGGLAVDFCDLGDTVSLNISSAWEASLYGLGGYGVGSYSYPDPHFLTLNDSRRVIQIDYTPEQDGAPELVALTFNIRLDDLSA